MNTSAIQIKNWIESKTIYTHKIKFIFNRSEVYKSLRECGLRYSLVGNRSMFYFRNPGALRVTNFEHFNDAVWNFLKMLSETEYPAQMPKHKFLELFLEQDPVRKDNLLRYILRDELSESEMQELKSQY